MELLVFQLAALECMGHQYSPHDILAFGCPRSRLNVFLGLSSQRTVRLGFDVA